MPIHFIGLISTRPATELSGGNFFEPANHPIDKAFLRDIARAHDQGDFDRVLIGYSAGSPDGFGIASYAAAHTEKLNFLVAHRPGFVAPTLAARTAATLDHFTQGRIAVHTITGGSDADQQRDGDWTEKDARYQRTDEYLDIVRKTWTSPDPFDYEGQFYRVKQAFSEVKPFQQPHIPLYFGGSSEPAIQVGAKHADVFMLFGEPVAAIRERITEVRAAALPYGRFPEFSVSLRPILGATETQAWARAHDFLERIVALRGGQRLATVQPQAVGAQRLLKFAADGEIHDQRLWTAIAAATGAGGNSTCLVGTPEQVAESLLSYYEVGVKTILIRGFEPLQDAIDYGRDLIPLVRAEVARRDRQSVAVA
ncbi:MAG: LLM class flavin-dependent oxidoreductase [Cyanobacteriota bacterium]|nr:LLM class flavin-dependent oxidoreductase [Cyanobacteriota bacterium]